MEQREQAQPKQERGASSERAARVDLSEFAEALSSGVVKALDRRGLSGLPGDDKGWPWIWAGWIIGTGRPPIAGSDGPVGGEPFGGGTERPG